MNAARQAHQEFLDRQEAIRKSTEVLYRGYTIEPTSNGCPYGGYDYYPTEEGRDEDIDWNGNPCGNVGFAGTIAAAKAEIDDLIGERPHVVTINEGDPFYEHRYEFQDFDNALAFAMKWGGTLYPNGLPIINP